MDSPASIPTKVLDKRRKDGWFFTTYYVTLQALTTAEDPSSPVARATIAEFTVNLDSYHRMEVGKTYTVKWYRQEDKRWGLQPPITT